MTDGKKKPGVGYCRPPSQSQFKKGQSGNPQGRPKGAKNLATIVQAANKERVIVNENGKRRSISKLEAAFKQLLNKAASGDHRSIQLLMQITQAVEQRAEEVGTPQVAATEADQSVMTSLMKRVRRQAQEEINQPNEEKDDVDTE